jgi:ribosomal-protein-alanine N-acetyltransferase
LLYSVRIFAAFFEYFGEGKIWINLRDAFPYPYSLGDAEAFISRIIEADPVTIFAIATRSEVIGSIGLMLGKDVHRFTAEMGYGIHH